MELFITGAPKSVKQIKQWAEAKQNLNGLEARNNSCWAGRPNVLQANGRPPAWHVGSYGFKSRPVHFYKGLKIL